MMQRNKITISFLPTDNEIWNYIQSKKETCNISQYIRNLILQDMNDDTPPVDVELIIEQILQAIWNNELELPERKVKTVEDMLVNENAKTTINSLF